MKTGDRPEEFVRIVRPYYTTKRQRKQNDQNYKVPYFHLYYLLNQPQSLKYQNTVGIVLDAG